MDTTAPIQLTWDAFVERFRPRKNPLDPNAAYDGYVLETYGEEFAFVSIVNELAPETVWTLVEDDEGNLVMIDGLHWVNRQGYVVTEVARKPSESFVVSDAD